MMAVLKARVVRACSWGSPALENLVRGAQSRKFMQLVPNLIKQAELPCVTSTLCNNYHGQAGFTAKLVQLALKRDN